MSSRCQTTTSNEQRATSNEQRATSNDSNEMQLLISNDYYLNVEFEILPLAEARVLVTFDEFAEDVAP